jgi:nicotianamine synthase
MTFACEDASCDGRSGTNWENFDIVFLAALVGMTNKEKMGILRGLVGKLRRGCLVVCRSARGLRAVLYPVSKLYQ